MSAIQFSIQPLSPRELALHQRAIFHSEIYLRTESDLLATIGEVDRTRLYLKFDLNSTFAYCLHFLKLSPAVTSNFINVARKSREVPELRLAVESGDLSIATARKIVPVLNSENQQLWIAKAKELPQYQLEREVADEAPQAKEFERTRPSSRGRVKLEFVISEEAMAEIRKTQNLVSSKTRVAASLENTIMTAIREYNLRHDPVQKAKRRLEKKAKFNEPNDKQPCAQSNVSQTHASPAKSKRAISANVQHAVNLRDQRQCQARRADGSKCRSARFLHLHHIIEVANGGLSTLDNLTTLCSRCGDGTRIKKAPASEVSKMFES